MSDGSVEQGLTFSEWPEGFTPLEGIITIKGLNAEGRVILCWRHTEGLSAWEALGMVSSLQDDLRHILQPGRDCAED